MIRAKHSFLMRLNSLVSLVSGVWIAKRPEPSEKVLFALRAG